MPDIIFKNTIVQIANYNFTTFALAVFLTSWMILAIGIITLIREKTSRESISFFLVTLTVFLWLSSNSFIYVSPNEETALRWDKLAYLGTSFIPAALFQFTIFALRTYPSQQRTAWTAWILSSFFSICAFTCDNFILGAKLYPWGYFTYTGWIGIPFLVFFLSMLLASLLQYYKKSQEELSPITKLRTRLFFRAIFVGSLAIIEFLPTFGVPIPPLGFIPILCFVFLGAPVIWRYHLVDVTPALAAQEVINNMSDALLVFDQEGIVQLVNPAFSRLLGKKEKEIKGLPVKLLLPNLFPPAAEKPLQERPIVNHSFTLHLESGKELFLEVSLSPIQKAGEILAWIVLIRDVTEVKKAEVRYRTIFENTGSATILVEEDMTISLVNREFEKIVGLPKEKIEGKKKFTQFFAPPDIDQMIEYHQRRRIVPEAVPKKYTTHLIDQKGNVREVLASVDLIPHTKQSIASLVDVTDLRRAEKQIALQLDMLSRLYRGAQELSETLDLEELARLTVRYATQDLGAKLAFFLVPKDNKEWEVLSAFPAPYPSSLQRWLSSPEKDRLLADLVQNGSSLVVGLTEETKYPQLAEIADNLAVKEARLFLLGKPLSPLGALIWLIDKPELLSSRSGFIQTFIQQVVTSGEKAQLFSRLQRQIDRMRSLHAIDRAIASSLDLQVVLNLVLQEAVRHLEIDAACVYLLDSASYLHYRAGLGFLLPETSAYQFRLGEGALGKAMLEKKPLFIFQIKQEDLTALPPFIEKEGFLSLFAVPLMAKNKTRGLLVAFHRLPLHPSPRRLEFLTTLAGQLAIAIDNITMFEELTRSHLKLSLAYDTTIEGWARALELRDQETEGHTRRTTELTLKLAQALGVNSEDLIHIRRGALLHDIGKMGIPDQILLKPGPLSKEEWKIMKKHPTYAWELLSPVEYLRPALDIPYCHHERWDGKGYPRGLKGEEIPLAARLFAVVDVWDALISDRPYRPAWPKEKAREYIKEQAGHHFDPQVVEKFLELLEHLEEE
ncbi:MAG: hypothetical protein PWP04_1730 [Candidatus Atribacteria bacterium]|nr:hypothetical protein [Candidatus Atribacteria bacterium]